MNWVNLSWVTQIYISFFTNKITQMFIYALNLQINKLQQFNSLERSTKRNIG